MFGNIKDKIKQNREKALIAGLSVATVGLAYYGLKMRANYNEQYDNFGMLMRGIDQGYTPVVDWDRSVITLTKPEPKAPKAVKTAAA